MTRKRVSKAREEEKPTLSPATRQFLRTDKKEIRKQRKRKDSVDREEGEKVCDVRIKYQSVSKTVNTYMRPQTKHSTKSTRETNSLL